MFAHRIINSTINTSRVAQFSTRPKIKIPARCLIEGKVRACRAVTKSRDITPGLMLKESDMKIIEMGARFRPQNTYLPFIVGFMTNNNPTDTGLVHWVCHNTLQKFADPTDHWNLVESFYHGPSSPMVDYMNNLAIAQMLENKSYADRIHFAKLILGSIDHRKEYYRKLRAIQRPFSDPLVVTHGSVQTPYEHTVVKSYNFRDTWKLTKRTVTVHFTTNNDPVARD